MIRHGLVRDSLGILVRSVLIEITDILGQTIFGGTYLRTLLRHLFPFYAEIHRPLLANQLCYCLVEKRSLTAFADM